MTADSEVDRFGDIVISHGQKMMFRRGVWWNEVMVLRG